MSISLTAILIAAVAAVVGIASQKWLSNDNAVEQVSEAIIKEETGLSIDLSSETKPVDVPKS